jgi:hypothetical protein
MTMTADFAILILSCDKYADLWTPFLNQFRKYFPIGGTPVYLGSNLIACKEEGVIPVLSGYDHDWSTSYRNILLQLREKKLFVILEDLLLTAPVDVDLLHAAQDILQRENAIHVKYWGVPAPDALTKDANVGLYERGAPYRASVCGFWDREYLLNLLIAGENPWNFEILGSYRTSYSDGFYGLTKPLCTCCNMVEKGNWIPASAAWAKKEGIAIDLDIRPILDGRRHLLSQFKMLIFKVMMKVPWQKRVKWMNTLRRVFISY